MGYVISNDCISCGACESECPVNCITEGTSKFNIDHSACIACGACADICPVGAIKEAAGKNHETTDVSFRTNAGSHKTGYASIDTFVGMDFGHGEDAVDSARKEMTESDGKIIPDETALILEGETSDKCKEIPTAILYTGTKGEEIKIGHQAVNHNDVIAYFKTRPDMWTDLTCNGRTNKQMMSDFFRILTNQIQKYNTSKLKPNDNILLLVGCPSTQAWTLYKTQYENLIREATGIKNVIVMPESRAAVFSAVVDPNTRAHVNVAGGIFVIDLGSSTADLTYMKLGEHLMEYSWTLGAHEIECAMLRKILDDNNLNPNDIYQKEEGRLLLDLREQKEKYFHRGENLNGNTLRLTVVDELGNPIPDNNSPQGNSRNKFRMLTYFIDDNFMSSVLNDYSFDVSMGTIDLGSHSWIGHFKKFLEFAKMQIEGKNLPCSSIVLTGGASNMPFVKEICRAIFPDKQLYKELNTSRSVSRGLLIAGVVDSKLPQITKEAKEKIHTDSDKSFDELVDTCVDGLGDIIYNAAALELEDIKNLSNNITINQMMNRLESAVRSVVTPEAVSKLIDPPYKKWLADCGKHIVDTVNDQTRKTLYPDQVTANHFSISYDSDKVNLDGHNIAINGRIIMSGIDLTNFMTKLLSLVVRVIAYTLAGILLAIPGVGLVLGGIILVFALVGSEHIVDKLKESNFEMSKRNREKCYRKFGSKQKDEIKSNLRPEIRSILKEGLGENFESHYQHLDTATDKAFEVVTLHERGFKNKTTF